MTKTAKRFVWALVPVLWTACSTPEPTPPKVPPVAKVISFTASPDQVEANESVTLSWEVENATSVAIRKVSGAPVELADPTRQRGTVELKIEETTVFVLSAAGEGGNDSALVSVVVPDENAEPLFQAFPLSIRAGQSATLVWNAAGATSVQLKDGSGAPVVASPGTSGAVVVKPGFTTDYELVVDGVSQELTISVLPAILSFRSDVEETDPGSEVTLSWSVGGAESVALSSPGRGVLTTVTDPAEIVDGSFTDTVPLALPSNGLVAYELAVTAGGITDVQTLTVYAGSDPLLVAFDAPPFYKEGTLLPITWQTLRGDRVEVSVDGDVVYVSQTAADAKFGTATIEGPAQEATVQIRVTNARGGETLDERIISPVGLPTFNSFSATPGVVAQGGDPITLSWDVTNARHVKITNQAGRVVYEARGKIDTGSKVVYSNVDEVYTFNADNMVGDVITPATAAITVTTPAKLLFSPEPVPAGTPIQVTGHTVPNGGAIVGLPTFVKNEPGTAFIDIVSTGIDGNYSGPDTSGLLLTLPQTFHTIVYGVPVEATQVAVGNNGWLKFATSSFSGYETPSPFPTTALEPLAIAPLWADLYDENGEVYYQLDTIGTEQRLIVQWDNFEYDPVAGSSITIQAQIYSSGRIVFAYKTLQGFTNPVFSVGVTNVDETAALAIPGVPAEGDTYTLFGTATLPAQVIAGTKPFTVNVLIGTAGDSIEITSGPQLIPPAQFGISEVNHNPESGKFEWIELKNNTAQAIDLAGWSLDFGGGSVLTLDSAVGTTVLPANGFLLLGQDADAAEASAGGPAVDYVYGTAFSMPDAAGSLTLGVAGGVYGKHTWSSAGTAGTATQVDVVAGLRFSSGRTSSYCSATATYGAGTQKGTPGAAHPSCFKYALSPLPSGSFQSILATGANVGTLTSTTDDTSTTLTLTRPVKIAGQTYGTLYVSSNGFIMTSSTSAYAGNKDTPSSSSPVGAIAPYWDDLVGNGGTGSKVAWQQFDPDGVAASGDEYTIISWENWKRYAYTTSLNFQVKFYEATGDFEFHYGAMTGGTMASGSEATSWYENAAGTAAAAINVNTAGGIQPNTGYRFTYLP